MSLISFLHVEVYGYVPHKEGSVWEVQIALGSTPEIQPTLEHK